MIRLLWRRLRLMALVLAVALGNRLALGMLEEALALTFSVFNG